MSRVKGRKPVTKQRSPWVRTRDFEPVPGHVCRTYQRDVHDGHFMVMVGEEPTGWHLSISHRTNTNPPKPGRYPSWDEIADARDLFLPEDIGFVMHLPRSEEYVAVHDTCFHLHEHPERAER